MREEKIREEKIIEEKRRDKATESEENCLQT